MLHSVNSHYFSEQRPESVSTVEPQLPLCGAGMVQATTCAMPVDCTTRWTAKIDL